MRSVKLSIRTSKGVVDFDVPISDSVRTILHALDYIRENYLPKLSFRCGCRGGICGSCCVMVNKKPVFLCATSLDEFRDTGINIEPLPLPVIKDLCVDYGPFYENLKKYKPWEFYEGTSHKVTQSDILDKRKKLGGICNNCAACHPHKPIVDIAEAALLPGTNTNSILKAIKLAKKSNILDIPDNVVCPRGVDLQNLAKFLEEYSRKNVVCHES